MAGANLVQHKCDDKAKAGLGISRKGEWKKWQDFNAGSKVEGEFVIPNNSSIRFRTGTREFKLLDITANNEDDATSIAVAPFVSSGVLETRQRTIQSTRVRNIVTGTSTSSSSSSRVTGRSSNTTVTSRNIVTGEVRVDGELSNVNKRIICIL